MEQNFITNAGSQQAASEHGIIIVAPDTSPLTTNRTHTYHSHPHLFPLFLWCSILKKSKGSIHTKHQLEIPAGGIEFQTNKWNHPALQAYDVTLLAVSYSGPQLDILIDQGSDD